MHDEADGIATGTTTEAVVDPAGRGDVKRRSLFVVEGAEALEVSPGALELDLVGADEVYDVGCSENL